MKSTESTLYQLKKAYVWRRLDPQNLIPHSRNIIWRLVSMENSPFLGKIAATVMLTHTTPLTSSIIMVTGNANSRWVHTPTTFYYACIPSMYYCCRNCRHNSTVPYSAVQFFSLHVHVMIVYFYPQTDASCIVEGAPGSPTCEEYIKSMDEDNPTNFAAKFSWKVSRILIFAT